MESHVFANCSTSILKVSMKAQIEQFFKYQAFLLCKEWLFGRAVEELGWNPTCATLSQSSNFEPGVMYYGTILKSFFPGSFLYTGIYNSVQCLLFQGISEIINSACCIVNRQSELPPCHCPYPTCQFSTSYQNHHQIQILIGFELKILTPFIYKIFLLHHR